MKRVILSFLLLATVFQANAQVVGDTIKVRTFHYGSNTRDTLANFPSGNLTYEKIIMKYNMRCKNALVSNSTDRNLGCGEWDYSCNTYIVDSSKVEDEANSQPNYVIPNFNGSSFAYTSKARYDYYDYTQNKVILDSILNESQYSVASGSQPISYLLKTNERSGKSQVIYRAAELLSSGLTAGDIKGLSLSVSSSGGVARFLKIRIKHTSTTVLNSGAMELTGFTEVFNSDYVFVNGNNRIPFKIPFTWNGTQNILIEFSFTNTVPGNALVFNGRSDSLVLGLYANNNYALDLANKGRVKLDASKLAAINYELTISFWAFGHAASMPMSTTILYAYATNPGDRQLNIHLPHSSNNIYFDCGFSGGAYDRINKIATLTEEVGQWNYWTFTKNAVTGNMKIFLNGSLWLSGTGKTKVISILNLFLGADPNNQNNYKGKINELSIWSKEMPDSLVPAWMNKPISASHPLYANLLAYYPLHEASGLTLTDIINNISSTGVNLQWTYDRGDQLNRSFYETSMRPGIQFFKGSYNIRVQNSTVRDSIKCQTSVIEKYSIISKAGISPLTNDLINLDTTYLNYYRAIPQQVFNGDSNKLVSLIPVDSEGVFTVVNLNYIKRYPFYNEIMSFVTPYGIGLDLGAAGKSWYFDVTDFSPILKGPKRILMTLGGQTQEQMDVEFWFVVGTPPRNVLQFNQIWQGAIRAGSASIASINNETRFAPVSVPLLSTGKEFKIRSYITGHGSDGEFEANGGPIDHMININGGTTEFTWKIVVPCSTNPVFPQGGTWVYDRQGWCPGQSSLLMEQYITSFVTPGSNASIDYNASLPTKTGGTYNFLVAHQLVTYGSPNFTLDARIKEVLQPTDKVLYSRSNPMCSRPQIVVQNTGSANITKLEINYWINNASAKQTYNWTGNLASMDTVVLTLPINNLWFDGILPLNNVFNAEIKKVNTLSDDYVYNNKFSSPFNRPEIVPGNFTIELRTNNNPEENSYKIVDADGDLIDSKTFATANTTYKYNYSLSGCYKIIVEDAGQDGLAWWANTNQGTGYMRILRSTGSLYKTFQPDFGSHFEFGFTTDWKLSKEEFEFGVLIDLYPNPNNGRFTLEGKDLENARIKISDLLGQEMEVQNTHTREKIEFNSTNLAPGVYFVEINREGKSAVKRFVVN